jgi:TolB-like protein
VRLPPRPLLVALALVWGAAALAQVAPKPADRPKLLVTGLSAQGVSAQEASAFTDAVVSALEGRQLFTVIAAKDVQTLQSAARLRQLAGACANEGEGCAADLGGALGARFVLTGSLSRYGETYELSLQMVDTAKSRRTAQSSRLAHDLQTLRLLVPYAAAEATGAPLPPAASRWKQYAAIASGAALVVAGGFIGMYGIAQEKNLNDELCPGGPAGGGCSVFRIRPLYYYQRQNDLIGRQKTIGLSLMLGGAALAAAGLYFMPPPEGGPRVALVPQARGVAVVGVFP